MYWILLDAMYRRREYPKKIIHIIQFIDLKIYRVAAAQKDRCETVFGSGPLTSIIRLDVAVHPLLVIS